MKRLFFSLSFILFLFIAISAEAVSVGESLDFNIQPSYDLEAREEISAALIKITPKLYFYIDENYWNSLTYYQQAEIKTALDNLGQEFEDRIYPILNSNFGLEWKPGIDKDDRITVLFHKMGKEAGGYFNTGDEYLKSQVPESNQREMVYLNLDYITSPLEKSFLAHEFTHLIIFNQKEKKQGISEETWLNEGRAEYAPTLIGYDDIYEGSNLQRRIKNFVKNPNDSITEWKNQEADYGSLDLFIQYLVEHYGIEILTDSLYSSSVGIASLNEALRENGFSEDFSQIFSNWLIAVLVNDCDLGENYCYFNQNLKKFKITPITYFLPFVGEGMLSVNYSTKNWAGNWQKFIGGEGDLKLEFSAPPGIKFNLSYLIETSEGRFEIHNLLLDEEQKGEIYVPDFRKKYISLTIIPSIQNKISKFDDLEPSYQFSWEASITKENTETEAELIKKLLAQIEELKKEIVRVQAKIDAILGKQSCQKFENDLYYEMKDSFEVRCLQEFLKNQGPDIYPEGLVSGNFLDLTKKAVIRFQEKYAADILIPLGLEKGTGFFGPSTRAKANQLLGY